MLSEFVKVATVGDVPDNSIVPVFAAGEEILLAKIGDAYFAIDDWCTHAAGMLDQGDLCADTFEVVCPVHEGMFDLRTGEVTNPPPETDIATYEVRVEGEDILVGPKS